MWMLAGLCALITLAWGASIRWTVFRMAQFGDGYGLKSGGVFYLWTTDAKRLTMVQKIGLDPEPEWSWHFTQRVPPLRWWCGMVWLR